MDAICTNIADLISYRTTVHFSTRISKNVHKSQVSPNASQPRIDERQLFLGIFVLHSAPINQVWPRPSINSSGSSPRPSTCSSWEILVHGTEPRRFLWRSTGSGEDLSSRWKSRRKLFTTTRYSLTMSSGQTTRRDRRFLHKRGQNVVR